MFVPEGGASEPFLDSKGFDYLGDSSRRGNTVSAQEEGSESKHGLFPSSQSVRGSGQRTESWRAFTLPRIDHEAAALIILYNKSQSIWH